MGLVLVLLILPSQPMPASGWQPEPFETPTEAQHVDGVFCDREEKMHHQSRVI
jgi:hypothetical protein